MSESRSHSRESSIEAESGFDNFKKTGQSKIDGIVADNEKKLARNQKTKDQSRSNSKSHSSSLAHNDFYDDEKTSLNHGSTTQPWNCSSIAVSTAKGVGALMGLGAGMFYMGPSDLCSSGFYAPYCGEWLSNLTTPQVARGIFLSCGAPGFMTGAAYMGYKATEATIQYISEEENGLMKVVKVIVVFGVTASQNIPLLVMTRNTATHPSAIILTLLGNWPGSWFGTILNLQSDAPYVLSQISVFLSNRKHCIFKALNVLTDEQKDEWEKISHYRQMQSEFITNTRNIMTDIVTQSDQFTITAADARDSQLSSKHEDWKDPLILLYQAKELGIFNEDNRPSTLHRWTRNGAGAVGMYLGNPFSAASLKNTAYEVNTWLPEIVNHLSKPASVVLTAGEYAVSGFFNYSMVFANVLFMKRFMEFGIDVAAAVLGGAPVSSAIYRQYPHLTRGVGIAALLVSSMSYAAISIVYLQEFATFTNSTNTTNPNDPNATNTNSTKYIELNDANKAFYYQSLFGINAYHAWSMFELYGAILSIYARSRNPKAGFLMKTLEDRVQEIEKMPEGKFIEWVNKVKDEEAYQKMGLEAYVPKPQKRESKRVALEDELILNDEPKQSKSCFGNAFNMFKSCFDTCFNTYDKNNEDVIQISYGNR